MSNVQPYADQSPPPSDGSIPTAPIGRPALSDADLDAIADRLADRLAALPPAPPPPLLTASEVADWLAVSERTVENLVALGELTPLRVTPSGRGRRFERATVEAYIRRSGGGRS